MEKSAPDTVVVKLWFKTLMWHGIEYFSKVKYSNINLFVISRQGHLSLPVETLLQHTASPTPLTASPRKRLYHFNQQGLHEIFILSKNYYWLELTSWTHHQHHLYYHKFKQL